MLLDDPCDAGRKALVQGAHRIRPLEETRELVLPWLADVGITRVADVTGLDFLGVPTMVAVRPNSRSISVSQGKGLTHEAAWISAVMEAFEHEHAENADCETRLARVGQLERRGGLCALTRLPPFPRLQGEVTADSRMLFARAFDLVSKEMRWVPYEMVHLDLTIPFPGDSGHFPISSNGLASGNSRLEAIVHGLCEVIERDARTLFFLRSEAAQAQRRILNGSIDDEDCGALVRRLESRGVSVALWDMTSDVGVACVLAAILENEDHEFHRQPLSYGSGCHCDRRVALIRAVTEAAQTRLTNIVGTRDDTPPRAVEHARQSDRQACYRDKVRVLETPLRGFDALPHRCWATMEQDLEALLAGILRAGLPEVLVVDLSRKSYPFSVVRVIVPGLEPLLDLDGYQPGERARRVVPW